MLQPSRAHRRPHRRIEHVHVPRVHAAPSLRRRQRRRQSRERPAGAAPQPAGDGPGRVRRVVADDVQRLAAPLPGLHADGFARAYATVMFGGNQSSFDPSRRGPIESKKATYEHLSASRTIYRSMDASNATAKRQIMGGNPASPAETTSII